MVAKTLVTHDIDGGRLLFERLEADKVAITAALWLYDPDGDRYRLYIATPEYETSGPLDAYRVVRESLDKLPADLAPELVDVNVVSPSDPIIQAIRKLVRLSTIGGVRFSRNNVNGIYIEDAWIYLSR